MISSCQKVVCPFLRTKYRVEQTITNSPTTIGNRGAWYLHHAERAVLDQDEVQVAEIDKVGSVYYCKATVAHRTPLEHLSDFGILLHMIKIMSPFFDLPLLSNNIFKERFLILKSRSRMRDKKHVIKILHKIT